MNILLFPTRFFPAISGGDFFLQRIGEEFRKVRFRGSNERFTSTVITSDAIDFAALHGTGKKVSTTHKKYSAYRGLNVKRYGTCPIRPENDNESTTIEESGVRFEKGQHESEDHIQSFLSLCRSFLLLDDETINYFIKMGPVMPELTKELLNSDFQESNRKKFDVIHCSYLPYANLLYALIIGKKLNIPVCVTPFLHSYNARYDAKAIFTAMKLFDKIFACTPSEKRIITDNGIAENKIEIVPMGVDWQKFTAQSHAFLIEQIYGVKKPLVLFCGYKNHEKGAIALLKAIPLILQTNSEIAFMFIGPSTTAFNYTLSFIKKETPNAQIINLSPDNLSGVLDKKKIAAFQAATIYCMPSRSDAYGIAYLEAWACKVPVIAAKNGAMEQVVRNGEDGLLVEFDNVEDLALAINYLSTHSQERIKMGEKGYEKIVKNNGWNLITDTTIRHYLQLIETRNKNEGKA